MPRQTGQANAMNCRFRAAAEGNIRLAAADHPRCIANGLSASRAGGDRRADGAPEAVGDGHMPGGQVGQKEGMVNGERRRGPRSSVVCTALAISLKPPIPVAITVAVRSCSAADAGDQPAWSALHGRRPAQTQ